MEPWLTVVTVVKDDPEGLARTVASLAPQDRRGVEHIVVDGSIRPVAPAAVAATSGTLLREDPRGIYVAMNTGLAAAQGRFAWFLNAGDTAARHDTIERMRPLVEGAIWAHGPVVVIGRGGRRVTTPDWDYRAERKRAFARGRFPAHQGTIASVAALRRIGGFDVRYRVCADYAAALRLSLLADPVAIPFPIACFHEGGTSTIQWRRSVMESHRARCDILEPRGVAAAIERLDTARQFAALGTYRTIERLHR